MAALAGESQNFDGNGQMVRFQVGGGTKTLSTGTTNFGNAPQFFNPAVQPLGVRPVYPGARPPYRPDVDCHTQQIAERQRRRASAPPTAARARRRGSDPPASGPGGLVPQVPNLPVPLRVAPLEGVGRR